ncbi:cell wall-binding repeat-containing protein [Schumannella luteola]
MLGRIMRAIAAVLVAGLISVGAITPAQAAGGPAGDVYTILNQQRAANGLGPLMSDPTLDNAAWQWANYLATTGQFLHSTSDWRNSMIGSAGWINSGENIAAGYTSAQSVMTAWMGSSGHRANILNPNYVGVGVAYVAGGPYGHYWVQIFAASLPRVPPGNAPVISGPTAVGATLTATTSGWPGGTSLAWTWQSNGVTVPGATSATYTPTISDAGRRITATVTGWLPGYYTSSRVSNQTSVVTGGPTSERLAGSDRFATSVAISKSGFAPGVAVAYVASGLNFPDALGAAPAATLLGGPLLLTDPSTLPSSVAGELRRLAPQRIVVVGGTPSVSNAVLTALQAIAPTERIAGGDRFETSREIVANAFTSSTIAYVSTGLNFPDALTASAAAGALDAPVVLVNGGASSADAETVELLQSLGVTSVRIVGSSSSVSSGIQSSLASAGFAVERLAGADRYQTAVAINQQVFPTASTVYLASGVGFPDALAGAALAGSKGAPLFVSTTGCIPRPVEAAITRTGATKVILLGGTPTLTAAVASFERCG